VLGAGPFTAPHSCAGAESSVNTGALTPLRVKLWGVSTIELLAHFQTFFHGLLNAGRLGNVRANRPSDTPCGDGGEYCSRGNGSNLCGFHGVLSHRRLSRV
jgi:hypothetical protein